VCDAIFTDDFEGWWNELTVKEQIDVDAVVRLLEAYGVSLGHPHSSDVRGSRYPRMRELRIQHQGRPYRVLYAFDPHRDAVLPMGGDKTGNDRWYEVYVPIADRIFEENLKELEQGEKHGQSKKFPRATRQDVARGAG